MSPVDVVRKWVEAFNAGDADALAAMYAPDAVNHQVTQDPVEGVIVFTQCLLQSSLQQT